VGNTEKVEIAEVRKIKDATLNFLMNEHDYDGIVVLGFKIDGENANCAIQAFGKSENDNSKRMQNIVEKITNAMTD
jgi:hypothetical protein